MEDKNVETTLYRGLVQVFRQGDETKTAVELKPNEKLVMAKDAASYTINLSDKNKSTVIKAQPRFTITQIDSTKKENERIETAWVYSRLEFFGDNFEELAQKLQRWYNVTIIFTDDKVKKLVFRGSFEKETVEQAFSYLREANPKFDFKIENHEIFIGSPQ